MGIFDIFFGGESGQLKRHTRRVADRDAQPEDREASASWLYDKGTDEALIGLCARFNLQLEHSMKDQKEKDYVADLLVEKGAPAGKAARAFARTSPNFQYPVRIVERIDGPGAGVDLLLELLKTETVHDEWKPEKKRTLLITLAERKDPRIIDAATPFLADFDEGVRHAAIEAMAIQDGDAARSGLLTAFVNPKEESTRVRGRLAEIFAQKRWSVPEDDAWLASHVPQGYRLDNGRVVASR